MLSRARKAGFYQAVGRHNVSRTPQWHRLDADVRKAVEVVSQVLPFRANRYVMESLIDWSKVPDDPIFQLVFPQRQMLTDEQYGEVESRLREGSKAALARTVCKIRLELNPHPNGQLTHNIPELNGRLLPGLQHKYRETVLFFAFPGQTCHAYCTYCFRWAQFVDTDGLKFASKHTDDLVAYLRAHPEVTDVLFTGGDPMVMRTDLLRRYITPLLAPDLAHVQNIRIGTKSVAYWPQRFISDDDADDCLKLFEEVAAAGRHLAIMGHYSHPTELGPEVAREAIRRIRSTGAQIRMQAPLVRHVNDDPEVWSSLWQTGVQLGLIPYYMFVERDTGARSYFEVPLARACEIYRAAYSRVSGLARSAQGPSMSALPGKVRLLGVVTLRELMGAGAVEALGPVTGALLPDERFFLCEFLQARDPSLVRRIFCAAYDPEVAWFDQLRPAFGKEKFDFEQGVGDNGAVPIRHLTESVWN